MKSEPCPWCHTETMIAKPPHIAGAPDRGFVVVCGNPGCWAHGPEVLTQEKAVESWNQVMGRLVETAV
jgi:hypothetical protein